MNMLFLCKRRNVAYLGLLPAPQDGLSDITDMYIARYGEPRPGMKVFIVTRQQQDGWEGDDRETNEIVPERPAEQQAVPTAALTLIPLMYKGCTPEVQGTIALPIPDTQGSAKPGIPGGEAAGAMDEKAVLPDYSPKTGILDQAGPPEEGSQPNTTGKSPP